LANKDASKNDDNEDGIELTATPKKIPVYECF
jgi:hypothetical protein